MASWHSDVFSKPNASRINFCYYRVIRVDNPAVLPLFWRPAGLKYLGSKGGNDKGCVVACTEGAWEDKAPTAPIKGDIEYEVKGQRKNAESWGPQDGWTANEEGDLKEVPGAVDPGDGSGTLVAHDEDGVRVEFQTRVLPDGQVRYSIRNLGKRPVRVVWNIAKNAAFAGIEGPFAPTGAELAPNQAFVRDVGITKSGDDARAAKWQTQALVLVEGAPGIAVAIPAVGPSTGRFDSSPREFWQRAGLAR